MVEDVIIATFFPPWTVLTRGADVQMKRGTSQLRDLGTTFLLAQVSARVCFVWILRVGGFIRFISARPGLPGVMVRGPVLGISMVCGYITICNSSCNESRFGAWQGSFVSLMWENNKMTEKGIKSHEEIFLPLAHKAKLACRLQTIPHSCNLCWSCRAKREIQHNNNMQVE